MLRRGRQQRRCGMVSTSRLLINGHFRDGWGGILIAWITSQIVLIGYRHPIQLVYLLGGAVALLAGVALLVLDRGVLSEGR